MWFKWVRVNVPRRIACFAGLVNLCFTKKENKTIMSPLEVSKSQYLAIIASSHQVPFKNQIQVRKHSIFGSTLDKLATQKFKDIYFIFFFPSSRLTPASILSFTTFLFIPLLNNDISRRKSSSTSYLARLWRYIKELCIAP